VRDVLFGARGVATILAGLGIMGFVLVFLRQVKMQQEKERREKDRRPPTANA
jgi:hypothetical protein